MMKRSLYRHLFLSLSLAVVGGQFVCAQVPPPAPKTEVPSTPPATTAPVSLGGVFTPATNTIVNWTSRSDMQGGMYTGIRGEVPMEIQVNKTEERTLKVTYVTATQRLVTVVSGKTTQSEAIQPKPKVDEKTHPLVGVEVTGQQTDNAWKFTLVKGTASPEQQVELDRMGRRADAEVDLFADAQAALGASWDLDHARFVKAVGLGELTEGKGTAKATLKTMTDGVATIEVECDLRGKVKQGDGSTNRIRLAIKGTWQRHLESKLDQSIVLEGELAQSGVNIEGKIRKPFSYKTPVKISTTRSVQKQ